MSELLKIRVKHESRVHGHALGALPNKLGTPLRRRPLLSLLGLTICLNINSTRHHLLLLPHLGLLGHRRESPLCHVRDHRKNTNCNANTIGYRHPLVRFPNLIGVSHLGLWTHRNRRHVNVIKLTLRRHRVALTDWVMITHLLNGFPRRGMPV